MRSTEATLKAADTSPPKDRFVRHMSADSYLIDFARGRRTNPMRIPVNLGRPGRCPAPGYEAARFSPDRAWANSDGRRPWSGGPSSPKGASRTCHAARRAQCHRNRGVDRRSEGRSPGRRILPAGCGRSGRPMTGWTSQEGCNAKPDHGPAS
jgi:hypothetical protein